MTIPEQVKGDYEKWGSFLENEVDFWLKTSEKHTKEHCSRVLLFCLLIADKRRLSQKETDILSLCYWDRRVEVSSGTGKTQNEKK